MKYGLSSQTYQKIKEIIQKYTQYQFILFGSRARGDYKKESDIDLAIDGNVSESHKIQIRNDFDLIDIPYMIDIVFLQELTKQGLIDNIKKEGIKYE